MKDPVRIDAETQTFNGRKYRIRKDGYFGGAAKVSGGLLHRAVWEASNCAIPEGYEIHHVNGNRADNRLKNLQCMLISEHRSMHCSEPSKMEKMAAWHRSKEGHEWHKQQYEKNCRGKIHAVSEKECGHCKETYSGIGHQRFCSNKCKAAARRASGIDLVTRSCVICEAPFQIDKVFDTKTCGRSCGAKLRWKIRRQADNG